MVKGFTMIVLSLSFIQTSWAVATNRTIDDQLGDSDSGVKPTYISSNNGTWKSHKCTGCFGGSYLAATTLPSATANMTLEFEGTAIWVYFVLTSNVTKASFFLDDNASSTYLHNAFTSATELTYNALIYKETGLMMGSHKLLITVSDSKRPVFAAFDFARYQYEDGVAQASYSADALQASIAASQLALVPVSTPPVSGITPQVKPPAASVMPGSPVAIVTTCTSNIAVAALGGIAIVMLPALLVILVIFLRRRPRQSHKRPSVNSLQFTFNGRTDSEYQEPSHRYTTTVRHPYPYLLPATPRPTGDDGDMKRCDTTVLSSTSAPLEPHVDFRNESRARKLYRTWSSREAPARRRSDNPEFSGLSDEVDLGPRTSSHSTRCRRD